MQPWEKRLASSLWAHNNMDKMRAANQRWRAANRYKNREQTAARTRRYRQKLKGGL